MFIEFPRAFGKMGEAQVFRSVFQCKGESHHGAIGAGGGFCGE